MLSTVTGPNDTVLELRGSLKIFLEINGVVNVAKVLVVDDSAFLAEKIKGFLESNGHEVVGSAEDGNEGFTMYKELKPNLVTLDITMPNRDGQECLSDILSFDSGAKVVMVSAIDDQRVIVDCMNIGAKGFIEKPLKFKNKEFCDDFIDTIKQALTH